MKAKRAKEQLDFFPRQRPILWYKLDAGTPPGDICNWTRCRFDNDDNVTKIRYSKTWIRF